MSYSASLETAGAIFMRSESDCPISPAAPKTATFLSGPGSDAKPLIPVPMARVAALTVLDNIVEKYASLLTPSRRRSLRYSSTTFRQLLVSRRFACSLSLALYPEYGGGSSPSKFLIFCEVGRAVGER